MSRFWVASFPIWAIGLSAIAFFFPEHFVRLKPAIIPLLSLIMFSMGMTLNWQNFKAVLQSPQVIAIGVGIQFICMPFFAWLIAKIFKLPEELLVGMVLLGSTAGGTASNVICYLAKGNVALSILMTMTSTLSSVVVMPALTYLYLYRSIPVPVESMMESILTIVLIPVISGCVLNSFFTRSTARIQPFLPSISSLAILSIIAIIVALNQHNLNELQTPLLAAIVLHNLIGLCAGYLIPYLLKYDATTCRTICIEVGMQNSGLSVALAIKYFSALAALPGALFSIWHNISGSVLASWWRYRQEPQ